ncbi:MULTISPECIES: type 1 fimbrial major subunit FimA [unclassified Acinetobacter]|uniref:type 1 fimbrial major subunit FimA n=1 Tax=unclassified Acinetobacter TaxID=196816 RepID=UPI002934DE87|nr:MULTISPECIES: type 1 fimbrial major subunit FimA [unclassified Acinetobacter]WOE33016.1 type 1 fimbrial major subunit FimA [Acinetobacter sp. SAAs470]WOE38494.1 type 1 fimbrial major subunit FimA [Acinetobacter sp. SAAs474]
MKKQNISLVILMMTVFGCTAVNAASVVVNGGTIHFTGDIIDAACAVSVNSENQTVKLGQYRTATFTAAGVTTTPIPFNIVLNECDPAVSSSASVAFNGQQDLTDSTLLVVSSSGSNTTVAKGVGIEIKDRNFKVLPPDGTTYSTPHTLTKGVNTLLFTANYKSTAASVTAGKADGNATFTINYQ